MKKFLLRFKRLCSHSSLILGLVLILLGGVAFGVCSCKAWRTITTTASYVQVNDSTKTSSTITSKTVEEYQGVKKR